jgi:hypothetical protein
VANVRNGAEPAHDCNRLRTDKPLENTLAIRQRMNHVAAGLLDSFYSRCNDLDGFWALGMLYEEVQTAPYCVELDLLKQTARPGGQNAVRIAVRYADFLRRALLKKNLQVEDLTEASVTVQFKANVPSTHFQPHWIGDAFTCTVRLRRLDDQVTFMAHGKCMPNDTRVFTQGGSHSTRRPALR